MGPITITDRVARLAAARPQAPALIQLDRHGQASTTTWRELDGRANHCAAVLAARGLTDGGVAVIALPNGLEHVVATLAAWKLGALVVPLDPRLREGEAQTLLGLLGPHVHIGQTGSVSPRDWGDGWSPDAPAGGTSPPRSASVTGGSTGRPRVILRRRPWLVDEADLPSAAERAIGLDVGQVQLVTVPLFHSGFGALHRGLALGHQVVVLPRFIPRLVVAAIEQYAVEVLRLVPTMMQMLLLPEVALRERNLSSVRALHHGTAPCPPEVKRAWIELLGPERVFESYSSQEQLSFVHIRGDEWLAHPGSVGRPEPGTVAVVGPDGRELPPGTVGRIFLRPADGAAPRFLAGAGGEPLESWGDGYYSVGDLGHLDADGYLFVRGRAEETIIVGGTNVYPAEVEAVLVALPGVVDACVLPTPHPVLGQVPHALVVPASEGSVSAADLETHCRRRLSAHKVPASYQLVSALPRTAAGKLRRSDLVLSSEDTGETR